MNNTDQETILIVDDTPEDLEMLHAFLQEAGFRVAVAQSGEAALKRVEHTLPDLILLDVRMPGLDGFEICRRFKANEATKEIPVIFMTVLPETVEKVKGFEVGGVDYLTKPMQQEEVLARVNTHLAIRGLQQELQRQNAFLKHILESITHPFYVIDPADYTIILANTATIRRGLSENPTCYALNHHRKTPCSGLEHPCPVEKVKRSGKPCSVEHLHRDKDGKARHIEIHAYPIFDQHGHITQIIEYCLNITEHRRMEEERVQLRRENIQLRSALKDLPSFGELVGKSPVMQEVYVRLVQAAASDENVLVCGESGTGKELVAQTIHQRSSRKDQAFVAVNCGAISESLFEREFFGHRKGTFTGAEKDTPGFFDRAHKGTLFLDEVGELTPHHAG